MQRNVGPSWDNLGGDVLAYLRELLRRAGYDVHTSSHLGSARILIRVTHFDLLLVGPRCERVSRHGVRIQGTSRQPPDHGTGQRLSTRDAGEAGAGLLKKIEVRLNPKLA